ncbi:hypothetical protein GCM10022419_011710 [Nonomuraea rosea]|uniref:Uncharacterized protein n=1 Tax=Nonomuraea rosea TaxID=638574 RepID=A0ABP6VHF1_9ACTN
MTQPMPVEEGGDAQGGPRAGLGLSVYARPQTTRTYEGGGSGEEYDFDPDNIEESYADHIVYHRVGDYPDVAPPAPAAGDRDAFVAAHRVDPGTASKTLSVKIKDYEDPATGNPLPTSPVEELRRDLEELQGANGHGLEVLLSFCKLDERDLGNWTAANDMRATTDKAQGTLSEAVQRVLTTYSSVVTALNDTVKTAKNADQAITDGLRTRT